MWYVARDDSTIEGGAFQQMGGVHFFTPGVGPEHILNRIDLENYKQKAG